MPLPLNPYTPDFLQLYPQFQARFATGAVDVQLAAPTLLVRGLALVQPTISVGHGFSATDDTGGPQQKTDWRAKFGIEAIATPATAAGLGLPALPVLALDIDGNLRVGGRLGLEIPLRGDNGRTHSFGLGYQYDHTPSGEGAHQGFLSYRLTMW